MIEATNDAFMCRKLPRDVVSCYVDVVNVCALQFPRLEVLRVACLRVCSLSVFDLACEMWVHVFASVKFLCVSICMKRPYPAGSIQLHSEPGN